jgi:hypothetical protein
MNLNFYYVFTLNKFKMSVNTRNDIITLLDSSASMCNINKEAVDSLNEFISEQQKIDNSNATFSLWTFNNKSTNIIDDQILKDVQPYTNFIPTGMTSIYDAIGDAITLKLTKKNYKDVICLIITDGIENSSKYYNNIQIKEMINDMELNNNWKFIYLGANQDVYTEGNKLGLNHEKCISFNCDIMGDMLKVTRNISSNILSYRSFLDKELYISNPDDTSSLCSPPIIVRQSNILSSSLDRELYNINDIPPLSRYPSIRRDDTPPLYRPPVIARQSTKLF